MKVRKNICTIMATIEELKKNGQTVYPITVPEAVRDENGTNLAERLGGIEAEIPDVVDNVTSTATAKALSANQGKQLNDRINNIAGRGRFLSLWNAATGMPLTNPSGYPYEYRTGDFFIVSSVGSTNYIPHGDTYDGEPSTTVYSGALKTNDTIFYDGSVWSVFDTPAGAGDLLDVYVNGNSVVVDGVAYVLVPTTLAELAGDSTHRVVTDVQVAVWNAKYTKPSGGIPATDLAEGVIVQEVFIVEHRVTTYAEIIAAAAAGKIIICNKDNTTYYGRNVASGQDIYLTTVPNTVGVVGYLKVTSANVWGSGTLTVENTANKVSAITAQSTNTQYAGAKAVYDFVSAQVGGIESLLAAI